MLLTSIPTGCKLFTVNDLCSAFFSILVDEASQYLFAFTWEERQFTWTVIPQGFTESPFHFSQILKAELNDVEFPRGLILLQNANDLLLCSPSQASSQEASIPLLKLLDLKGQKLTKEEPQFAQNQV